MASNYTENYGLCQWENTNQVLRSEFNADNAKVDEVLHSQAENIMALVGGLEEKGNCQMELITYTGTGTYGIANPTRIQFSSLPEVVVLVGEDAVMLGRGGVNKATLIIDAILASGTSISSYEVNWTGNELCLLNSSSAQYQMNLNNRTYWAVGLRRHGT